MQLCSKFENKLFKHKLKGCKKISYKVLLWTMLQPVLEGLNLEDLFKVIDSFAKFCNLPARG